MIAKGSMLSDPNYLQVHVDSQRIVLVGDLDAASAELLVAAAEQLVLHDHRHLVIDCTQVGFCDSYGLRALKRTADLVAPDGSITIANPSATLTRILDISGLASSFATTSSALQQTPDA